MTQLDRGRQGRLLRQRRGKDSVKSMFRQTVGIAKHIHGLGFSKVAPLRYANWLGVSMGEDVHFYGMKPGMFSTEPWLIRIGDHVHITSGCQFITHDGGTLILRGRDPDLEITAPIVVGDNVYIGMNSIILPGVTIGDNVVIGAGSVVSRSIPSDCVAAGVPARVIRSIDEYYDRLQTKSLGFGSLSSAKKKSALRSHFRDFIKESKGRHG